MPRDDYGNWPTYVSADQKRKKAERELAKLGKKGYTPSPVVLEGRQLATTFWGKAWGDNLEAYSDFASRLPRGRAYARNGSVLDLQINGGEVNAMVMGSQLYHVKVKVQPLARQQWASICADCSGSIDSLVELLQGRLSSAVMARVCQQKTGLFPAPAEIKLSCTCPDAAGMCKHVAAVLYGVGARLDSQPALVFKLRAVDEAELIAGAAVGPTLAVQTPLAARVLDEDDLSALFGLELGGVDMSEPLAKAEPKLKAASKPKVEIEPKVEPTPKIKAIAKKPKPAVAAHKPESDPPARKRAPSTKLPATRPAPTSAVKAPAPKARRK
jgi:uncharacterized Zn finger protein